MVIFLSLMKVIDTLRKKIELRDWILNELEKYEEKFGLDSKEFAIKWQKGEIPEPDNHELLEEFLEWDALVEALEKIEEELKEIEKRIKES